MAIVLWCGGLNAIAFGLELDLGRSPELSLFEGDHFVGWWIGAIIWADGIGIEGDVKLDL